MLIVLGQFFKLSAEGVLMRLLEVDFFLYHLMVCLDLAYHFPFVIELLAEAHNLQLLGGQLGGRSLSH